MICDKEGKKRHGSLQYKSGITITSDKRNHQNGPRYSRLEIFVNAQISLF
jgi:hypothetical protein